MRVANPLSSKGMVEDTPFPGRYLQVPHPGLFSETGVNFFYGEQEARLP
jgi:hypothetical protein